MANVPHSDNDALPHSDGEATEQGSQSPVDLSASRTALFDRRSEDALGQPDLEPGIGFSKGSKRILP